MARTREIQVGLFGALRDLLPGNSARIEIPESSRPEHVRSAVAAIFAGQGVTLDPELLRASAVATGERVLLDGEEIPQVPFLALLPPVSGG